MRGAGPLVVGAAGAGDSGGERRLLQHPAHQVELVQLGGREAGDRVAAARAVLDEPLPDERLERLADRDDAHPEHRADLVGRDRQAGRRVTGQDHPPQLAQQRPRPGGVARPQRRDERCGVVAEPAPGAVRGRHAP
ncbi:hypothetical protein BJF78_29595 [Pseudonocardia sp. CNS-139]|nr:hypothetical protein BJF78_29595 [Pseudonocardia sp. CNS-139]